MQSLSTPTRPGRPKGSGYLDEELVAKFSSMMRVGVKLPHAAAALGVSVRSAYSWREKGKRLSVEFLDDLETVPPSDRIYLHFLHEIEMARAQCIAEVVKTARQKIKSTMDALKFLEYVCPEEFGPTARARSRSPKADVFDLNREIRAIVDASNQEASTSRV